MTLYDPEGFQVPNSLNRFAVSSWMPFKYNSDGSLDLYFQNESPGGGVGGKLASRAEGSFQPDDEALCPEVRRAHGQVEPTAGCKKRTPDPGP